MWPLRATTPLNPCALPQDTALSARAKRRLTPRQRLDMNLPSVANLKLFAALSAQTLASLHASWIAPLQSLRNRSFLEALTPFEGPSVQQGERLFSTGHPVL